MRRFAMLIWRFMCYNYKNYVDAVKIFMIFFIFI